MNDGLVEGIASTSRAEAMPVIQAGATLMRSAYVQFDERVANGASSGPGKGDPGNFESSKASDPTRNLAEYSVIFVPRISF